MGRLAAAIVFVVGSLAACSEATTNPGRMCTEEARASVMVSVVDAAGLPLAGATVTWRVDGGGQGMAECAEPMSAPQDCARFVAGWEVSGQLIIRAEKPGFSTSEATVSVGEDEAGCHVMTQNVTVALLRSDSIP